MIRGALRSIYRTPHFSGAETKDVTGEADRRNTAYADGGSEVAFNDAGFPGDDDLKDGQVNDEKRSRCMTVHIAAGR